MRKLLIIILCLIIFLLNSVSCAENIGTNDNNTNESTLNLVSGEETEIDLSYTDDISELNFEGTTFTFLLYGDGVPKNWSVIDMVTEEISGEVINDAIITRNREIEERFNVLIDGKYDLSAPQTVKKIITANDNAYDAVWLLTAAAGSAAQAGQYYSFNEIPNINLEKSYWEQSMISCLSIGGNIYFLTGDISTIDNQATWMMLFNKNMVSNYKLENPYELVNSGAWVIDKFRDMVKDITQDIDGNGKFDKYDQYGLSTTADTIYGLFYSCGAMISTKNENDFPEFTMNVDKVSSILEKTIDIISKDDSTLLTARITNSSDVIVDIRNAFEEDRALFYSEVMFHIAMLRQMDTDFGIIPLPKFDTAQENYITFVNPAAPLVSIPISVTDTLFSGTILEAMAASSYRHMTPAYYEIALKGKYARDEESSDMLDMLLINRAYDLGLIYAWGTFASSYNALAVNGKMTLASLVAKSEKSINKEIEKFNEAFEKMQ